MIDKEKYKTLFMGAIGPINDKEAAYFKKKNEAFNKKSLIKQTSNLGFNDLKYKFEQPVSVTDTKTGDSWVNSFKGLNKGHALQNARFDYEGFDVNPITMEEFNARSLQENAAHNALMEKIRNQKGSVNSGVANAIAMAPLAYEGSKLELESMKNRIKNNPEEYSAQLNESLKNWKNK